MRLKTKITQYRRDFTGLYECEHCGHEQRRDGYDDTYFHQHVIPNMTCTVCGRKAAATTPKTAPDVAADVTI